MTSLSALMPPFGERQRTVLAAVALGAAALLALGGTVDARTSQPATQAAPLPASPTATDLASVSEAEALALNASRPVAGALGAARPFLLSGSANSRAQALQCLSEAIYYEAGQESDSGQRAVAQVILNRARHPAFPSSVCGVVYQGSTRQTGCQFTFTCDGSLDRGPMPAAWARARANAQAMLAGAVEASVGQATHYHADYVFPRWAPSLVKTQVIGPHIFYRWSGNWGRPAAFAQAYAGREADAGALRHAALAVPHSVPAPLARPAIAALDAEPRVEIAARPGGRVTARFKVGAAREAVEKVKLVPYVERVKASDTLRYALGDGAPSDQPAFGTTTAAAGAP